MINWKDSRVFYEQGNFAQYEYVLSQYKEALRLKCETKKKPQELKKLDDWFQDELPIILKKRRPDVFFTHDELVMCIKWKLAKGKFRPRLKELVQMNTPRVVMVETKKAYRQLTKRGDVQSAITALSNMKGVGPAFASAVVTAMCPDKAPFMADECIMAINNVATIDYTLKEYMQFVEQVNGVCARLNKEGESHDFWNPHRVEMALWAHYVLADAQPASLDKLDELTEARPGVVLNLADTDGVSSAITNGNGHHAGVDSTSLDDEDSRSSANGENVASSASSAIDDESSRDSANGKLGSPKDEGYCNGDASNDSNGVSRGVAEAEAIVPPSEENSNSSVPEDKTVVKNPEQASAAAPPDSSSDSAVDVCDNGADEPDAKRARIEAEN